MKKKYIRRGLPVCLLLLAAGLWGWRVYYMNTNFPDIERVYWQQNEWVDLSDDVVFAYDSMDGYQVRVLEASIWEYEDFLEEYDCKEVSSPPERIYLVKIDLRHIGDNMDSGIMFQDWYIQATGAYEDLNDELYYQCNGLETTAVALRADTSMEFLLPYNLRETWYTASHWKNLSDVDMWLSVTWYPRKHMISLNS